jgi:hypothetical protein
VKRRTLTTFGLAALTAGAMATPAAAQESQAYSAQLDALNSSGDSGSAMVEVEGNQITVMLNTSNTSPGSPHPQHIHIGGENVCPTADADEDGDGLISTPEGQPAYGEIHVSLTTEGDTSVDSALAVDRFPVAGDDGAISYERTFDLPEGVSAESIANGVIVQHGFAESDLGEDDAAYDGQDSPLMAGVPQEATLPASCGPLEAAPAGGVQTGGGGTATTTTDASTETGLFALAGLGLLGAGIAYRKRATA